MSSELMLSRRKFLQSTAAICCGVGAAFRSGDDASADDSSTGNLIQRIDRSVIFNGRRTGTTWFQPRCCMIPVKDGNLALMTLQTIGGSDYYGPVHWTASKDGGATWSRPEPIPGLGRRKLDNGWEEGVCDVVPEYHQQTGTVLAVGHNVYYQKYVLARPQRSRWPVYVVRSAEGKWTPPRKLNWDDPRGRFIYTCNCGQRATLPGGDILIPLSFGSEVAQPRSVASARCSFNGEILTIREIGNVLSRTAKRGLLEPSLVCFDDRYYMTIRAEDNRGYVAVSDDGLRWEPRRPWAWDDGKPLVTSTTQQHWLPHSDGLFLIYTRKDSTNENVIRWRAPLFTAEVDRRTLRLIRASEEVVLPLSGDSTRKPKHVALMGNFNTTAVGPGQSWVTVGENRSRDGWAGDTLLAHIRWRTPNRLAS